MSKQRFFRGKYLRNSESNAQSDVAVALQNLGFNIYLDTSKGFQFDLELDGVEGTFPDLYWGDKYDFYVYLDGAEVHRKKATSHRDRLVDEALERRKIDYLRFEYESPLKPTIKGDILNVITYHLLKKGYIPFKG